MPRSTRIYRSSASAAMERHSPGIGRAANGSRSARSRCRPCTSGRCDDTVGRAGLREPESSSPRPTVRGSLRVGHYAADQVPERVTALLLEHLARIRSDGGRSSGQQPSLAARSTKLSAITSPCSRHRYLPCRAQCPSKPFVWTKSAAAMLANSNASPHLPNAPEH